MSTEDGFEVPERLWKLTIQPQGTAVSADIAFDFCRKKKIVGVGWGLPRRPDSKKEAKALTRREFGVLKGPVNALVSRMEVGDHAWVYGEKQFWICRIDSDWEYRGHSDPWETCDIHHIRKARWKAIPEPLVPGVIKRNLFQRGTAHQMRTGVGEATRILSGWLFATTDLKNALDHPVPYAELTRRLGEIPPHNVLQLLDPDEVEDVAGLWMQAQGWWILKSSTYRQKKRWECEFTRSSSSGPLTAYLQVKSGNTSLPALPLVEHLMAGEQLFLVSTAKVPYPDRDEVRSEDVTFLDPSELLQFITENLTRMPAPISLKLALASGLTP